MSLQSKNDLSILGSGLLGLTGLSLLLFQSSIQKGFQGLSSGILIALGVLCFILSLASQMMLVTQISATRESIIRACGSLVLLYFSGISIKAGLYPEALILLVASVTQVLISPYLIMRLKDVEVLRVITPVLGLTTGLGLIFADTQYEGLNRSPYSVVIGISFFFATALFGI